MELNKQFIEEISQFETIYCLVSGGYHSTTSALLLHEYEFKNVILIHNKTYLEINRSMEIIEKLKKATGYKYLEIKPDLKGETVRDIMKRSLQKIPEVLEDIKNNKYDRRKFECCDKLKKIPTDKFMKMITNDEKHKNSPGDGSISKIMKPIITREESQIKDKNQIVQIHSSPISKLNVIIDSQCPYESKRRGIWLQQIRNNDTYLRYLKKRKFWKAYPFRDQFKEKSFYYYLLSKGFGRVQHSGCVICPILVCFKIYNKRYYNTLKAMVRAEMPCFQNAIEDYSRS